MLKQVDDNILQDKFTAPVENLVSALSITIFFRCIKVLYLLAELFLSNKFPKLI